MSGKTNLKRLAVMGVFLLAVFTCGVFGADGNIPGGGTEGDPYLIEDFDDFEVFADSANAATYWASGVYTHLETNIDLDPGLPGRQTYTVAVIAPDSGGPRGYRAG
jgi:alkaline phosphatase